MKELLKDVAVFTLIVGLVIVLLLLAFRFTAGEARREGWRAPRATLVGGGK